MSCVQPHSAGEVEGVAKTARANFGREIQEYVKKYDLPEFGKFFTIQNFSNDGSLILTDTFLRMTESMS